MALLPVSSEEGKIWFKVGGFFLIWTLLNLALI